MTSIYILNFQGLRLTVSSCYSQVCSRLWEVSFNQRAPVSSLDNKEIGREDNSQQTHNVITTLQNGCVMVTLKNDVVTTLYHGHKMTSQNDVVTSHLNIVEWSYQGQTEKLRCHNVVTTFYHGHKMRWSQRHITTLQNGCILVTLKNDIVTALSQRITVTK